MRGERESGQIGRGRTEWIDALTIADKDDGEVEIEWDVKGRCYVVIFILHWAEVVSVS